MRDKQCKKAQTRINKYVKTFNRDLTTDTLWRGRFQIRQREYNWSKFDDGSGGILNVWFEIRDLKTGTFHGFLVDNYNYKYKMWEKVNWFIAERSGVWENIQAVKDDTTDFSKVTWSPKTEIY